MFSFDRHEDTHYLFIAVVPSGKKSVAIATLLREGTSCSFCTYLAFEKELGKKIIFIKVTNNLTKKYAILKKRNID